MADDNWQKVRTIFDEALRQKPEERLKYVRRACGKNEALLADVESLLESLDSAENFLEKPAIAEVAGKMLDENRQFSKGQFLNHYEIIGQIGTGGMGEVYLAHDTKLSRRVALKILRENLLSDDHAKQRLLREAQAAAQLEHPHICAIYEVSEANDYSFIVMQYVEGETLADLLAENRLTAERSLDLAIQIADALAEAHTHNLIHRDIKPANIIVNEKGQAKVLDFGLAKFIEAETKEETAKRLNSSGAVMGTVPYMSPEQLCGKRLDARTDLFSFGALVYEMFAGRRAFAGESNAERISSILNDQPDLEEIPVFLQPIIEKCLMKTSEERYRTAQDLLSDLRDARQRGDFSVDVKKEKAKSDRTSSVLNLPTARIRPKAAQEEEQPGSKPPRFYFWKNSGEHSIGTTETKQTETDETNIPQKPRINKLLISFAALAFCIVTGASVLLVRQFKQDDNLRPFDALHSVRLLSWKTGIGTNYNDYRLSHNGKMIAFSSTQNGENEGIYIKQTAEGEAIRVTKDAWYNGTPVWSPDDQRIAFASVRDGKAGIYVCPSFGGAAVPLKIIGEGNPRLQHWTADGAAIFYESEGNFFRLDLATREIAQITDFTVASKRYFSLSPDEKQIVFCDKRDGQNDIWTMPLAGGLPARLTNDRGKEMNPRWHADSTRILYNVERDNDTQIFLAFADGRAPVQVTRGDGDYELIDISPDGTKIFYTFWEQRSIIGGVAMETGEEFEFASGTGTEFWADVSPDGKSVVYQTNTSPHITSNLAESSIIVKSLTNNVPPILLKGYNPRWLPDSRRVGFLRWHDAEQNYQYWLFDTANGEERQLTTDGAAPPPNSLMPINRAESGRNWSPDASRFVYLNSEKQNIRMVSLDPPENANLTENANPNVRFYPPQFSPDGKRIAYLSTEKPEEPAQNPKWRVWLNEQGKSKEIFSTAASLRILGWSASSDEILLAMTDGVMKASPLDVKLLRVSASGESRVLTIFKNVYASTLTLSADGKTIAFTARQDDKDSIWTAAVGGGEAKKITTSINPRLYFGSPAWSPDGKTIFFDKQEGLVTISMFENFQ